MIEELRLYLLTAYWKLDWVYPLTLAIGVLASPVNIHQLGEGGLFTSGLVAELLDPLVARKEIDLPLENLIDQEIVSLLITIFAKITQESDLVIQVCGMANGRQDSAAGRNARDDNSLGIVAAENHVELSTEEGGNTALGDDHLVIDGSDGGVDLGGRVTLHEQARGGDAGDGWVGWVKLGVPRAESSDNMDHFDVVLASGVEGLAKAFEVLAIIAKHIEGAFLDIEDE